ncbi:MAG: hypothetical protein QM784_19425 [Polyangiaceae bacterium]
MSAIRLMRRTGRTLFVCLGISWSASAAPNSASSASAAPNSASSASAAPNSASSASAAPSSVSSASVAPNSVSSASTTSAQTSGDPLSVCVVTHQVARGAYQKRNLLDVRGELGQCASDGCPIAIRFECREWLAEAERQVPTVVLSATAEGGDVDEARVTLDGTLIAEHLDGRPIEAPLGIHVVRFELPDGRHQEMRVLIGIGEKERALRAEFPPLPATRPTEAVSPAPRAVEIKHAPEPISRPHPAVRQPDLAYVLGLLSIGSAVAAGSLLYVGIKERDSTAQQCSPVCSDGELRRVRRWFILADVAGAAAAISGGVSVYLYVTGEPKRSPAAALLQWSGSF